jgi:hypothetical protein
MGDVSHRTYRTSEDFSDFQHSWVSKGTTLIKNNAKK